MTTLFTQTIISFINFPEQRVIIFYSSFSNYWYYKLSHTFFFFLFFFFKTLFTFIICQNIERSSQIMHQNRNYCQKQNNKFREDYKTWNLGLVSFINLLFINLVEIMYSWIYIGYIIDYIARIIIRITVKTNFDLWIG